MAARGSQEKKGQKGGMETKTVKIVLDILRKDALEELSKVD